MGTDGECGAGFFATADSTAACAAAPCDMDTTAADKTACCTALATCDKKTDGSSADAVTDGECGAGFFATADSTAACAAAPCDMDTTAADKTACCTAILCTVGQVVKSNACTTCPAGTTNAKGDDDGESNGDGNGNAIVETPTAGTGVTTTAELKKGDNKIPVNNIAGIKKGDSVTITNKDGS